jgi:hypothetical protein
MGTHWGQQEFKNRTTPQLIFDFHNLNLKFMGEIWGVRCKGFLCTTMSELKHIRISKLKLESLHICL